MADRIDTTRLTNEVGNPVADNNHTLTAGERGPMMLQDNWMIEKLAHFDREVIPERRMHAKGSGAYGTFKVTGDISKYTKAKVLQPGAETEVFVRFSTVAGERGEFPSWRFCVQIMDEATAKNYKENPFDITKTWSQKEFPLIEVGTLELNRNPENYFAEVEQAAFAPTHLVPGIGLSPDKLLQGRLFAYGDAQRYRLGVNHNHIPVNRPRCPYAEFHRDGMMRTDGNFGGTIGYEPNSYGQWQQQADAAEPPLDLFGPMDAWDPADDPTDDTFYQPGDLYRLMGEDQRAALIDNTARNMDGVTENIRLRHAAHCYKADPEYGDRLAAALVVDVERVHELAAMTHEERMAATGQQVPARKIGGEVRA